MSEPFRARAVWGIVWGLVTGDGQPTWLGRGLVSTLQYYSSTLLGGSKTNIQLRLCQIIGLPTEGARE